jgi:hypothetical protein
VVQSDKQHIFLVLTDGAHSKPQFMYEVIKMKFSYKYLELCVFL